MAQPINDYWFESAYFEENNLRKQIADIKKYHAPFVQDFPNFLRPLSVNDLESTSDETQQMEHRINVIEQEYLQVRKHKLTPLEKKALRLHEKSIRVFQRSIARTFKRACMQLATKNVKWNTIYEENLKWLFDDTRGGFIWDSARQGLGFNENAFTPLINELKPGMDIKQSRFYKELTKLNDTMLINRTLAVDYFKNRNDALLSQTRSLSPALGALATPDPFQHDPSLRQQFLNEYNNMKYNTSTITTHNNVVNLCNRVRFRTPPTVNTVDGKDPK